MRNVLAVFPRARLTRVVVALIVMALAVAGCARNWPEAFPEPYSWQQRSAPLNLLGDQDEGVAYAVSAYAIDRPPPPASEQAKYRDDRRTPSRLDVICVDDDSDGYGRLSISLSLSESVLRLWHPREWERWVLSFPDATEISVPLGPSEELEENEDGLDFGFVPYIHSEQRVGQVMDEFRRASGRENTELTVRADFLSGEDKPPLEWSFDLGSSSGANELLKNLVEVCGGVW